MNLGFLVTAKKVSTLVSRRGCRRNSGSGYYNKKYPSIDLTTTVQLSSSVNALEFELWLEQLHCFGCPRLRNSEFFPRRRFFRCVIGGSSGEKQ